MTIQRFKLPRELLAIAGIGLLASSQAGAAGLIDDDNAVNLYRPTLSITLAKATGDDTARARAGGFMVNLEAALKVPKETAQIVDYPKPVTQSMLRIISVVPPKGMEDQPIPVCAEQNNKIVGTWSITPKGEVVSVIGNWSTVSASPTSSACKEFILTARAEITKLAQQKGIGPRLESSATPPAQ